MREGLELKCLYIYVHITMSWWQREHIFNLNLSSIQKKNAAIHKCFTSGFYWENYAVDSRVPVEAAESHFFLVFAGQCLDGRGEKQHRSEEIACKSLKLNKKNLCGLTTIKLRFKENK